MAAHQRIAPTDVSLNFVFEHLMARVTLSVSIIDPLVEQTDVMNASACLTDMRTNSKLDTDIDKNYVLAAPDGSTETRQALKMYSTWSDQTPFSIQFKCLFPPQTLSKDKKIIITLGNGKEYVCRLSKDIALEGGKNAAITAKLKASEDAVLKPVITVIPNAASSCYSGNRIFASIEKEDGTYCLRVFNKQADGTWGAGETVYEDENGVTEFPNGTYTAYKRVGMSGYKLSMAGNILASNSGVFQYNANTQQWDFLFTCYGNGQRVATDGKRVIFQNGTDKAQIKIYNITTRKEEAWNGTAAEAGVGKPIAIYEDYALAGGKDWLNICYRKPETGKWGIINPDGNFLEMMKHWNPALTITQLDGILISLKGTRAMITSDNVTYFVENIDEMVKDWLANPY